MSQERANSPLAGALRLARWRAGMPQDALAAQAGVSPRSCWHAEQGRGSLATYVRLAAALGQEITGRSLPPGDTLGGRLRALRRRLKASLRAVAAASGLSVNTVHAVERDEPCHLSAAERVAQTLGARLTLVALGESLPFYASAATSSVYEAWTTPPGLLERLYRVLGGIFDLDPCSPGPLKSPVRAGRHYTVDDDGLVQHWFGQVYMNPPYSRRIGIWTAKARREVEAGRACLIVGLLPVSTGPRWWHADVAGHADVWILRGRLKFGDGGASAPFDSALVLWGGDAAVVEAMKREFEDAHYVPATKREPITGPPAQAA